MKTLTTAAFIASLAASVFPAGQVAQAGGRAAQDPCSAPLPVQLAFTSGPPAAVTTLRGMGATMSLVQFPGGLNAMAQRIHRLDGGPPLVPNDQIAEFTFFTPGRSHIYGGPVHVFRHGAYQHVCRVGVVMVDAHGNTTEQANPYRLTFRFDGSISGTYASGDVWTAGAHYRLVGATRSLSKSGMTRNMASRSTD